MKKRMTALALAFLLLTACSAPWNREETEIRPVDLYYMAAPETSYDLMTGGLYAERRDLGTQNYRLHEILQLYMQGPLTEEAQMPFPPEVTLEGQSLENGCLTIRMSEAWDMLSGVNKHLAEACLVLTMTQFEEVDAVRIQTAAGEEAEPMTGADFLLYDDSATSDQVTVKLYFSDSSGRYLVEETRSHTFGSEEVLLTFAVNEMIAGPVNSSAMAVIPAGTNLLRLELEEGVCTLDFSEAFQSNAPKTHSEARMTIFSIVNALTEQPQVESVRFLCVGQPVEDYAGLDLTQPLYREELALGQNRTAGTSMDETLYVPCGSSGNLAAVPTLIRQSAGKAGAEAVLSALLSFKPANGYENPFPDGTMVMELTTVNGVCRVTFNSAFGLCDADAAQAQKAVRSVVTTLCALDGIDEVQLTVNGGTLTSVDISEPLHPEAQWVIP